MGFQRFEHFAEFVSQEQTMLMVKPLLFFGRRNAVCGHAQVLVHMIKVHRELCLLLPRSELFPECIEDRIGPVGHRMHRACGQEPGSDGNRSPMGKNGVEEWNSKRRVEGTQAGQGGGPGKPGKDGGA